MGHMTVFKPNGFHSNYDYFLLMLFCCVQMSGSRTKFSKYHVSGSQIISQFESIYLNAIFGSRRICR